MRRAMIGGLVCGVLATTGSGCALLASANAHHNSRGTACIDTPAFAIIDLLIGGASAAIIAETSDDSLGWLAVPAVFLASGTIGAISAIRCQGDNEGSPRVASPASNTAPSFGDAYVDPEARPATAEEMGIVAPPSQAPATQSSGPPPKLQLDLDYDLEQHERTRPATPDPDQPIEQIPCGHAPGTACPADHSCAIAGGNAGYCVPDRDR